MLSKCSVFMLLFCLLHPGATAIAESDERPRARDIGLAVGTFKTGPLNAITDVRHVRVGHATRIEGDDIRTGVTAIIPGPGNLYTHPIPAWIHVGNGYGKLIGETQVREFGEIETPILLTCTLCVWSAANALKEWMYQQPGMGEHTLNPVVGETNDSRVNNMWADPVGKTEVFAALDNAAGGPVGGRQCRCRYGHAGLRLEGRHRYEFPRAPAGAWWQHRGRSGADQLRRHAVDERRTGRSRAGKLRVP
jgi:D-aminopeptidase